MGMEEGYLHPMLFALLYKILVLLHLDTPSFMIKAPQLLQSLFSAVGDLFLYKFSHILFGDCLQNKQTYHHLVLDMQGVMVSIMTLVIVGALNSNAVVFSIGKLDNRFTFFCFNRTFSNSLESVLSLVGLYFWPSMRVSSSEVPSVSRKLGLAALACAIRPTMLLHGCMLAFLSWFLHVID